MTDGGTHDVIVLGSGIAGLSAALAAATRGLDVVVLEKADLVGGGTTQSYGLVWVGDSHLQRQAGLADDRDEILRYLRFLGGGELDEARLLAFVDNAPRVLLELERCGVRLRITRGLTDHYLGMAPGAVEVGRTLEAELIPGHELGDWRERVAMPDDVPCYLTIEEQAAWGGLNRFSAWDPAIVAERRRLDMRGKGPGLISHFLKALIARGVPVRTGAGAARLTTAGERVNGVVLADGRTIAARRGVVIATGGYDYDLALARALEGFGDMVPMSPTSLTGDGLIMAAEIGAVIHRIENCLSVMLGYTVPSDVPGRPPTSCRAGIVELLSPHTLLVNRAARRFADESFFQGLVPHLRAFDAVTHLHPNVPCYLIFDQQYPDRFSFANLPAGSPVPAVVARADTIEGLAARLGLDGGALAATVTRFNTMARNGADTDFHRGERKWRPASGPVAGGRNPALGPLDKPPFYGIELKPSVGNSTGLLTNAHAQVMHHRRRPIPGLYATGVAAARTEMGAGYQAGLNLASGMTFSTLAVEHMAAGSA